MARINIEDCWWTDPRRSLLIKKVGSDDVADGIVIKAWRLAQEFWKNNKGLVPLDLFQTLPHFNEIIESKLAVIMKESNGNQTKSSDASTEYVYVRGSSAYLDWVREKREQASEAGKKSAEIRRQKNGTAQPQGGRQEKKSKYLNEESNENRTESNEIEPSGSSSDSISNNNINNNIIISPVLQKQVRRTNKETFSFASTNEIINIISKERFELWNKLYPEKDFINRELIKVICWLKDHPQKNKKSLRGWHQFLSSWFDNSWKKLNISTNFKSLTRASVDELEAIA